MRDTRVFLCSHVLASMLPQITMSAFQLCSTLFNFFTENMMRKFVRLKEKTNHVYYLKPELSVIILELSCHTQFFSK